MNLCADAAAAQAAARPILQLIAADAGVSVHLETGLSGADLLAKLRSGIASIPKELATVEHKVASVVEDEIE